MLKIGTAETIVSPPLGLNLCGYPNGDKRKNTGILLDLKAKALALDDGKKMAIIITSDIIGLNADLVKKIRDGIAQQTSVPADSILVSCSHTHSGPYLNAFGNVDANPVYIEELLKKMIAIGKEAVREMVPVTAGVGVGQVDLCQNRRVVDAQGKSSSGWQDPDHTHTGIVDKRVFVLVFKTDDGKVKTVIANYACHPVVMGPPNMKVSADYPGYMQQYLEKVFPGSRAMFANAGGGNANPYICIGDDDGEARKMGETLGREVERVIGGIKTDAVDAINSRVFPLELAPNPNPGEKMKARIKDPNAKVKTEVQMIRLGKDILIVTAPGELLVEIALKIKEVSAVKNTLVFAYANGSIGYIPPPEIISQGGYEVDSSLTHEFQPAVVKLIKDGVPQV
jgi:hypothetical protein